jgi:Tfp pilus assembly protein PilN
MIQARPLDLNILPARYRPRRIGLPAVLAVLLVIAALLGLWPTYNLLVAVQARTAYLQMRLDEAKAALDQVQAQRVQVEQRLAGVEDEMTATQDQIARLHSELDSLSQRGHPAGRAGHSTVIVAAIDALIPRVQIVSMAQEGETMTLTGQAGSQALVLDYARSLQASGAFANVRILSMVNADPLGLIPDVTFAIEMEQ